MKKQLAAILVLIASALFLTGQTRIHSRALNGTLNYCSDGGSNDTYTCTVGLLGYVTGQPFWFKPNTNNTGAATLNVDSLGAKTIVNNDGTTLADNTLASGRHYLLTYDGTNLVLPPAGAAGSGDVTDVGDCGSSACFSSGGTGTNLTFRNATSGTVTLQTVTGALGTVTLSMPAATDTIVGKQTTDILTNKTVDVEGTGNSITTVEYKEFIAAVCQGAAPSTGFSLPASNAPTLTCENNSSSGDVTATTAVSNFGTLSFAENGTSATSQSVQGRWQLPADWTGNIDADVVWRTTATTNDVLWRIQTLCVADGEVGNGTWNSAQSFTADTAKGTTLQWNNVTQLTTVTVTGCAAGETLLFRFWRDATQGGDTLAAAAELISLRFKYRRTQ